MVFYICSSPQSMDSVMRCQHTLLTLRNASLKSSENCFFKKAAKPCITNIRLEHHLGLFHELVDSVQIWRERGPLNVTSPARGPCFFFSFSAIPQLGFEKRSNFPLFPHKDGAVAQVGQLVLITSNPLDRKKKIRKKERKNPDTTAWAHPRPAASELGSLSGKLPSLVLEQQGKQSGGFLFGTGPNHSAAPKHFKTSAGLLMLT